MPAFAYKARNLRGELLSGRVDGASMDAVADELMRSGLTPVEVKAQEGKAIEEPVLARLFEDRRVSDTDLMLFARQMASLLKAGVPILRALASLAESSSHKAFRGVLNDVREGLAAGRELSACLHRHPTVFQPFFVSMVRVGEATGRLDEVFMRLFQHLEFEKEMHERVKSALRYPSFVIAALVVALGVINVFVIPAFAKVYTSSHVDLPLITQLLIGVSAWTVAWWPYLLGLLVLVVMAWKMWLRTPDGR
jgi:MSHA biogenesis protein MshG